MNTAKKLQQEMLDIGQSARQAAHILATLSSEQRNAIVTAMADGVEAARDEIKRANKIDLDAARTDEPGKPRLSEAMLDRLELNDKRIDAMVKGLRELIALPDPVGEVLSTDTRPNGLKLNKVRVPIGVVAIIYESRPNVTADASGLCIKTANAVVLRGGKEALHSNRAIAEALQRGGEKAGLPPHSIQLVQTTDREAIRELVQLDQYIDVVIPRGGEAMIRSIAEMSRIPVIKHSKGVCHTFVDKSADIKQAVMICINAKCQRPGVCNAMETLLVHEQIAEQFLPEVSRELLAQGVELRGDEHARKIVPQMKRASEQDWYEEYLDLILAVRVVADVENAIAHINHYGSRHSDAIVSNDTVSQKRFVNEIDSATVYVNASTRFTDGGEFGMGAEIGISTDKLHARGPMGLPELTTYKWVVYGAGQVRG